VSGDGVAAQRGLVFTYLIIARGDSMRDVILPHAFLNSSGSLAMFTAMRRASSFGFAVSFTKKHATVFLDRPGRRELTAIHRNHLNSG